MVDDIAMISSVVSAVQIPDPSAEGLFNIPQRPRNRVYQALNKAHSLVSYLYRFSEVYETQRTTSRSFTFGNITTASYQIVFVLDPVGEQASRWSPLISVGGFFLSGLSN